MEQASAAAARAASLARTPSVAEDAARRAAAGTLDGRHLHCTRLDVDVQASSAVSGGRGGQVGVTVTCLLDLSALSLPGVPGSRRITGRSVSVLDVYRSAQ